MGKKRILNGSIQGLAESLGKVFEESVTSIQESTKQEIGGLRQEMGELRQELRQEIGGSVTSIQESTKQEIGKLRQEMGELHQELRHGLDAVEQYLAKRIDMMNKNVQEGIGRLDRKISKLILRKEAD